MLVYKQKKTIWVLKGESRNSGGKRSTLWPGLHLEIKTETKEPRKKFWCSRIIGHAWSRKEWDQHWTKGSLKTQRNLCEHFQSRKIQKVDGKKWWEEGLLVLLWLASQNLLPGLLRDLGLGQSSRRSCSTTHGRQGRWAHRSFQRHQA